MPKCTPLALITGYPAMATHHSNLQQAFVQPHLNGSIKWLIILLYHSTQSNLEGALGSPKPENLDHKSTTLSTRQHYPLPQRDAVIAMKTLALPLVHCFHMALDVYIQPHGSETLCIQLRPTKERETNSYFCGSRQ